MDARSPKTATMTEPAEGIDTSTSKSPRHARLAPVAQSGAIDIVSELKDALTSKDRQLQEYRDGFKDRENVVNKHAEAVAEGRIQQIRQLLLWISEIEATNRALAASIEPPTSDAHGNHDLQADAVKP